MALHLLGAIFDRDWIKNAAGGDRGNIILDDSINVKPRCFVLSAVVAVGTVVRSLARSLYAELYRPQIWAEARRQIVKRSGLGTVLIHPDADRADDFDRKP